MVSASSELSLELSTAAAVAADFVPKALGLLLKAPAVGRRRELLDECLERLEEERQKIYGFRNELPLCMKIVTDAIKTLKAEVLQCRRPEVGELGPVVKRVAVDDADTGDDYRMVAKNKDGEDKMNWLRSMQLGGDTDLSTGGCGPVKKTNEVVDIKQVVSEELNRSSAGGALFSGECKSRASGGAFTPFNLAPTIQGAVGRLERMASVPDLSLRVPPAPSPSASEESGSSATRSVSDKTHGHSTSSTPNHQTTPAQTSARKPRRCWSPDLHRRFTFALDQLGGPYVATPKQIREIMQVDGLTNDEVKSHLQKYRLHAKRAPATASTSNQPVGLMRSIWVPRDPCRPAKYSVSNSRSPQGPLELGTASRAVPVGEEEDGKSPTSSEDVKMLE